MPKRALDLTADSSDSSESSYTPSSRRTRARSSSQSAESSSTAARFAAASPFLAPRSKLLGGVGTGLEDKPKLGVEGDAVKGKGKGKVKVKGRDVPLDTDSPGSPSKKKKKKKRNPLGVSATPDGVLSFAFQTKDGEAAKASQDEQRRSFEFAEGKVLLTTYVKEIRGRPRTKPKPQTKGKAKGRRKRQDSSTESSESSDDDSDNEANRVDLDTIIGSDPDKQVVRALVVSPRMQVPWTPHRFATTRENKPRQKKIKAVKSDEKEDEEDKKEEQKPTFTRHYADKIPLLLLHDEADTSDWQEWTNVVTHRPHADVGKSKKGGMEAKLVLMVRRNPPSQRHSLRIAIHTSKMDANTWKKTENSIWVQDFPQLVSAPLASPALNPTHTPCSSGLLDFLLSDAIGLPKTAAYKPYTDLFRMFDFSSSKDVRLATSLAGSYDGSDAVEQGGGLTSLARAIEGLQPRDKGKWKVEYLTHTTDKISLSFVEQLFAAFCGIPPTEHSLSSSSRSKALATSFAASKSDKLVVLFPSEGSVEAAGKEGKIGREELRWEGEEWDELRKKDARGEVCRDVELKSGRVGHHTVALVIHQPLEKDKTEDDEEQYEAFLYVGSHTLTPSAWGLYTLPTPSSPSLTPSLTLPQTHLGVLLRLCTAPTWPSLKSQIDEMVPWERPVRKYGAGGDGGPARIVERKERKKAGRPRKKRVHVGEEEDDD